MGAQLEDVALSIAALTANLGRDMNRVTVVVMSEFGRHLQENSDLGTKHGRAGTMLLPGNGLPGGQVHVKWSGLEDHHLEHTGDLWITTGYGGVLGEVVKTLSQIDARTIFSPHNLKILGVTNS